MTPPPKGKNIYINKCFQKLFHLKCTDHHFLYVLVIMIVNNIDILFVLFKKKKHEFALVV